MYVLDLFLLFFSFFLPTLFIFCIWVGVTLLPLLIYLLLLIKKKTLLSYSRGLSYSHILINSMILNYSIVYYFILTISSPLFILLQKIAFRKFLSDSVFQHKSQKLFV